MTLQIALALRKVKQIILKMELLTIHYPVNVRSLTTQKLAKKIGMSPHH